MIYCKCGKICWAKLSRFSQFPGVPQMFFREYFLYIYKLCIMALFTVRHRVSFLQKLYWAESAKVKPIKSFRVYSILQLIFPLKIQIT